MSQEFSGTQTMPIPIEEVWAYLLNVNKAISPDTTRMNWNASLDMSVALARLGAQMMRGTVEKLTGEFFEGLKKSMQAYYRRW